MFGPRTGCSVLRPNSIDVSIHSLRYPFTLGRWKLKTGEPMFCRPVYNGYVTLITRFWVLWPIRFCHPFVHSRPKVIMYLALTACCAFGQFCIRFIRTFRHNWFFKSEGTSHSSALQLVPLFFSGGDSIMKWRHFFENNILPKCNAGHLIQMTHIAFWDVHPLPSIFLSVRTG